MPGIWPRRGLSGGAWRLAFLTQRPDVELGKMMTCLPSGLGGCQVRGVLPVLQAEAPVWVGWLSA